MKKTMLYISIGLITLLVLIGDAFAAEKVAWFKSGSNSRFWPVVEQIMQAAAKNLELELDVYEFKNDPFHMVTLVKDVLADPKKKPDCILIHNFKKRGEKVLALAEEYEVPIFIFNSAFGKDSQAGTPRQKYPQWIGQMVPDDEYAGYLLAKELIITAKNMDKNKSHPIEMVALEGNRTSEASNQRVAGLKRALTEHPEVTNNQFFHSKWKQELAKEAFRAALHRYPQTSIFWTASESMAIGVIGAGNEQGLTPGKDFITGGFDLLPENKKYIESGDMAVSVGGHYFEGAWVLVLIHDYLNGIDFGADGTTSFTTKMTSQSKDDFSKFSDIYSTLTSHSLEELDFKQLSKHYNSKVKTYNFDLDSFLKKTIEHNLN